MPVVALDYGSKDKSIFVAMLIDNNGKAEVIHIGELPSGKSNT